MSTETTDTMDAGVRNDDKIDADSAATAAAAASAASAAVCDDDDDDRIDIDSAAATTTIDADDLSGRIVDGAAAAAATIDTADANAAAAAAATTAATATIDATNTIDTTIDTADANAAATTTTAPTTTKKRKGRRKSKFGRTTKGAVQKPSHPNPVRPQDRTIAAASLPRRSVKKTKRNSNDVTTIKRLRISEQRLSSRLEETKEDIEVAVSEAVAVTTHKLTTANQNQLTEQQAVVDKIQSVTAAQLNKLHNTISTLKNSNLAASTKFQQQLSNSKEKHRSEVEQLTSKHETNINKVQHQHSMQLSRKATSYNRQLKSSKAAQTLELFRQKKEYNTKIASITEELQHEKKEKRKALSTSNSKNYIELREVKRANVRLETQLEKKEKMNEEEQCKLNDDLCDAKNKYDTLLAQSKKDQKRIGLLGRKLGTQIKTTTKSMHSMIDAEMKQRENMRQKNIAQKTAAASMQTTDQVQSKLQELHLNYGSIVEDYAELEISHGKLEKQVSDLQAASPITKIEKVHDKSISNKGGQRTWPTWMWILIMEQLVSSTPPTAIVANILSVIKVMAPNMEVNELPSISTVRKGRTLLDGVCSTLAAYKLAKADTWKQLHTDGTSRRQITVQNLIVSLKTEDGKLDPVLLSTSILAENESSEVVCDSILDTISCKGELLTKWKDMYVALYGEDDTDHDIPPAESLCITKMADHGTITTDTCNGARKIARLLKSAIEEKCVANDMTEDQIYIFVLDCWNHLRNVWIGEMNKALSKYLADSMREDLDLIDSMLRVTTKFDMVLRAVDKEFSLNCNYCKGHGDEFNTWMLTYHPGSFLLPVVRGGGSRQDFTTDGAGAVFMNRTYYVQFLDQALTAKCDNILQKNLFIILTSVEMIALSRVYSIFHVAICLPLRYLTGACHKLGVHDFSFRSMGEVIDVLDEKLNEIVETPSLFIDHEFMSNIFYIFQERIPAFKEHLIYMFEEKVSQTVDKKEKEIKLDKLMAKLFFGDNEDTNELVKEMGVIACKTVMEEFRNTKKATYESFGDGDRSWANTTQEEHEHAKGAMATNDLAEHGLAIFTQQVQMFNIIAIGNAAGTAQAKMNKDFDRKELGKKHTDGLFHQLNDKMKNSLVMVALKMAPKIRIQEAAALQKQSNYKLEKQKILEKANIEAATEEYTQALVLIEQYHSPACLRNEEQVEREYIKLTSETAKINLMKQQITIRVKGFGWKETCHHAWSKEGTMFTGDQLKDHLVNVIFPYERLQTIPTFPKVNLPTRQSELKLTLGTVSHDVKGLNENSNELEEKLREKADEELELRDIDGNFQAIQAPKMADLLGKRIQYKFEMDEVDEETGAAKLIWYTGRVVCLVNNGKKVRMVWEDEKERDSDETLLPTKYNRQTNKSWRLYIEDYKTLKNKHT